MILKYKKDRYKMVRMHFKNEQKEMPKKVLKTKLEVQKYM
jgi:hypothetical protein